MLVMIIIISIVLTGLFIAVAVAGNRAQGRLEAKRSKPTNVREDAHGSNGEAGIAKNNQTLDSDPDK